MIDIHNHILPGVDDGASDIYETLEMVRLAEESGVTAIVATPHCNITGGEENYYSEEYIANIRNVREIVKEEGFSVEILPGAEAFATPQLPELLQDGKIMTLNQSKYLLMEFDFHANPEFAEWITEEVRKLGVIPVIAHPERYRFVQKDPNIVYRWRMKGYPIQINKGSFLGKFGNSARECAYLLMDHHLVSVVASDAHSPYRRTPHMRKTYQELLAEYPKSYVEMVFEENPRRICNNEPILGLKPREVEE